LVSWGKGSFARELVQAEPKVILATGMAVATAVKGQTSIIPVIFVQVADPSASGFVKSLAE
jgi:ABC-type uncharacterized transport system substrate-binding protein